MLLPYAAKCSGDSWGTVRRSGGKGDIGFYAPVSAPVKSAAAHGHKMAPVELVRLEAG